MVLIGLDGAIAARVYEYANGGKLPAIQKLINAGVFAENALVPFPTITPPNWTTIATGAWPGTHGVTCFFLHTPGDPLGRIRPGFNSGDCRAEYIWEAAERAGRKSIVLNYPSTWPSRLKDGIQIGGAGISINEWRTDFTTMPSSPPWYRCALSDEHLFSTEFYPLSDTVEFTEASNWNNLPESHRPPLQAQVEFVHFKPKCPVKGEVWNLLVYDSAGTGYDRTIVSLDKDAGNAFAHLTVGQWTGTVIRDYETEQGKRAAAFRCKLIELSPDAERFRLYVTPISALDGWSHPPEIAGEVSFDNAVPVVNSGFMAYNLGWLDARSFLEMVEMEHKWLADTAVHLLTTKEWDLFFMHAHGPDFYYHCFTSHLEVAPSALKSEMEEQEAYELEMYQGLDRMIGRITAAIPEDTVVILVSDHGCKANARKFATSNILIENGFTVLKELPEGSERMGAKISGANLNEVDWSEIDWSRTRAVVQRSCYIYLNVKGRDPEGIVEPGVEYEEVRDAIVRALYDYTDPETCRKPIRLALKREDARLLGLYGDRVGDIIYAIAGDYGDAHGSFLPTERYGKGSMEGLLVLAGPGLKQGFKMGRIVRLTDIVPTICHLLDIPVPRDTEGAIMYQALEEPNAKLKEMGDLRRNYDRLKNIYEKERALTHTYNM